MKIIAYRTSMPFDNRELGSQISSLSPLTNKSVMPFNNVLSIQDILSGEQKISDFYPNGGGNWSPGEDVSKSYREEGNDYKRESRDMDLLRKLIDQNVKFEEKWKVKIGNNGNGGSIYFSSLPSAQDYARKNNLNYTYITRIAQNNNSSVNMIANALNKTFMVESLNPSENVREIGATFCVKKYQFLTCAHVIKKYNKNIDTSDVGFHDTIINIIHNGQMKRATLIKADLQKDMALLSCGDIDVEPFEIEGGVGIGEEIFAIGSPHGYENNVSTGTVASLDRKIFNYDNAPLYMFINATILPGNSGGPIIKESSGKVIGMVTMIVSGEGESVGLNAGLQASYLEEFIK